MYFGGKKAHRLARLVYTIHDILKDAHLAGPVLDIAKKAFESFAHNK